MKVAILIVLLFAAPQFAGAQKTYTPSQLRSMVKSGKYPDQGKVGTVTYVADFENCKARVAMIFATVGEEYPTLTIAQTKEALVRKIWTNDSAITVTCSAVDEKMVVTSAPYL